MLRWVEEEEVVEARVVVLLLLLPGVNEVATGAGDGEATAIIALVPKRVNEKAETLLGRVLERADAMKKSEDCLIIIMVG